MFGKLHRVGIPARAPVVEGGAVEEPSTAIDLSVVIPAYNEDYRLGATLCSVEEYLRAGGRAYEVLVVDDGSSDGTVALVTSYAARWPELRILRLPSNQGKGAAVRLGMISARGRLRLFSDADMSTPISELTKLEEAIAGGADVAIASRASPESQVERHQPVRREWMGRLYNLAVRRTVLPGLHDTQCGFKLFTAPAAESAFTGLVCLRYGFDAEVLLRASRAGLKIAEVGVIWRNSDGTRVSSVRDGGQMLVDLWRLRRSIGP